MNNSIMIYCPELSGHRQIYCDVLIEFFLSKGFSVTIAAAGSGVQSKATGESLSPYIDQYLKYPSFKIVDISNELSTHRGELEWQLISDLQRKLKVGWTFFINGVALQNSMLSGRSLRLPKLYGNNCGIFDPSPLSFYLTPEYFSSPGQYMRELLRTLKFRLKENLLYRVIVRRWKFKAYFFPVDEFPQKYNYPEYHYFPDIYRSFRLKSAQDADISNRILSDYGAFLRKNEKRDVILYFGLSCRRKGYDYMIKLVHDHEDLVFVHAGGHFPGETYDFDVEQLKRELLTAGRLYEFDDTFLTDSNLIDALYNSTKYILLPYRHHYNSSGILIQASEYGKPVLVPDVGYLNTLVKRDRIGLAFRHLSYADFESQFIRLRGSFDGYVRSVIDFHQQFKKERLYEALEKGLGLL